MIDHIDLKKSTRKVLFQCCCGCGGVGVVVVFVLS